MPEEDVVMDETLEVQEEEADSINASQVELEELRKRAEIADNYKIRAEKAEKEKKALEDKLNKQSANTTSNPSDSIDLIKLGKKLQDYSDEELDFVTDFAKSKKPEDVLAALDNSFVQMGIKAQREKVEKDKLSLKPSGKQSESDIPQSLEEALSSASLEERERILADTLGYSFGSKDRADKVVRR